MKKETPPILFLLYEGVRTLCRWILFLAVAAGVIFFALDLFRFWVRTNDFVVQEITIEGNHRLDQEEIRAIAGIAPGTNIWLLNLKELAQRLEAHPLIRRVGVQRIPPRRIHVQIEECTPIAFILNPANGVLYGVDEEGEILPELLESAVAKENSEILQEEIQLALSYPVLSGDIAASYIPGEQIKDEAVLSALEFFKRLQTYIPETFKEIAEAELFHNGNLVLHPRRRIGTIILRDLASPDLEKKIGAFWQLLEKKDLRAIYVDARFPDKGFAVCWDETAGARWKELYHDRKTLAAAGVDSGEK